MTKGKLYNFLLLYITELEKQVTKFSVTRKLHSFFKPIVAEGMEIDKNIKDIGDRLKDSPEEAQKECDILADEPSTVSCDIDELFKILEEGEYKISGDTLQKIESFR